MARIANKKATYLAAESFRDDCLSGKGSLLWPKRRPWTLANLKALQSAILQHLDESERNFFAKLKDQLAPENDDVSRVASDILAFYYLFPASIGSETKLRRLRQLVDWKGLNDGLDPSSVEAAYSEEGIGNAGQYYNTGVPWLFVFLVQLGIDAFEKHTDLADPQELEAACDRAKAGIPSSTRIIRNATLHLLLPDLYERIASDRHKRKILEVFADYDPGIGSEDERISKVREALQRELGRTEVDFYSPDVITRWSPDGEGEPEAEPEDAATRIWIEKTKVKGQPQRISGPNAVGRALWSPQKSDAGADIYRFMRDVKPGDIVLHLTDNQAFTGMSQVAASVDDQFVGLPGTEWEGSPGYKVRLMNYRAVDPPLDREVFFGRQPFQSELRRIAADGTKNLFYNSEPSLNQGAYFTPAPPPVVEILNAAYRSVAGRDLVDRATIPMVTAAVSGKSPIPLPVPRGSLAECCSAFGAALRTCGVSFGARHDAIVRSFVVSLATKRFVILTGLSGSGKTQLALRFGQWLGESRYRVVPVRPDWTGADALFGFEDALQKAERGRRPWHVPDALQFMLRAARDPYHPYLLLLDEMNLAHVERYFADVLSGMESGERCLPNLAVDPDEQWRLIPEVDTQIPIPRNLFIVGTVNVDETTYMFSPKVLDRANTFEFRVGTQDLEADARRPVACEVGDSGLVASFADIAANPDWHNVHPAPQLAEFVSLFKRLHEILLTIGFEYGHRTFVEAVRFASLLAASGDASALNALDLQIMQKILPRMHGARRRMEPVLRKVGWFCLDPEAEIADAEGFDPETLPAHPPRLPISFDKIRRMTGIVRANQFVSFTE